MKRALTALTALIIAVPAFASEISVPSGTYAIDPTHTRVFWKVNHFGLSNFTAQFNKVSGTLNLDADNPAASTLVANVDSSSVVTAHPLPEQADFDAELRGEPWLNSAAFPQATFKSTNVELTGDKTGRIDGELTFLGVTKPVSLDVTLVGQLEKHPFAPGAAIGFSAQGSIKRSDFGLNTFIPNVGDKVQLVIETELIEQK